MSTQLLLNPYANKVVDDDLEASEEGSFKDEIDEEEEETRTPSKLILVAIVLAASVMLGLYALSMAVFSSPFVSAAGAVAVFIGVAVVKSEIELNGMETFRSVHNKLRKDVMVFAGENVKLTESNDKLNLQVFMLKENEQRLQALAAEQNSSVQELVKLVDENQKTMDKMHICIHNDLVESLINAAFEGERNEDGEFSDREIRKLVTRLQNIPAVTINEELLTETIQKDRSVMSLIEIIRNLNIKGEQLGDRIFMINEADPALVLSYQEDS